MYPKTLLGAGTTTYYYQSGMLLGESRSNGVNLVYYYDEQGLPFGLQHNGTYYFYLRNIRGDILGLMDANGTIVAQYTYDALGQLTRVDSAAENKSYVYAYDAAGNILSRKTYAYTTGELGAEQSNIDYGYTDVIVPHLG